MARIVRWDTVGVVDIPGFLSNQSVPNVRHVGWDDVTDEQQVVVYVTETSSQQYKVMDDQQQVVV